MNRVAIPPLAAPPATPPGGQLLAVDGDTMGTTWSVRAFAPDAFDRRRFEADIAATLDLVIAQMSSWAPASTLSRFNAAPAGAAIVIEPAFADVLSCALKVAAATEGAFDPTLGAVVDVWGFGPAGAAHSVSRAQVAAAHARSGWRRIAFDEQERRLTQPGEISLDLSGIAKGYAVDAVAALARASGLVSFLVEIGGELSGAGVKPDGEPWWIEIEQPPGAQFAPLLLAACGIAVATSGDYRRNAVIDGVRVSHTIDPACGAPVTSDIASVTVLHHACMWADAYATALTVMGAARGLQFAKDNYLAARFVLRNSDAFEEILSPALAAMMD